MEITHTNRGFALAEFTDHYGQKCSIQDSSLADPPCLWLGVDSPKDEHHGRMHLTQEQAAELLPLLLRFINVGSIWPA